jgi:hypothetical protein
LHDYYTTCTDIDIDRYTHTHTIHTQHTYNTHTHTHTTHTHYTHTTHNTHTHTQHTHTHTTHTHTHNTHTLYTHTIHTHTHTTHTHYTHTQYTHTHTYTYNTRSGELHCSRSVSYNKKRQTTLQQKCVVQQEAANYVHADLRSREAKEVEAPSKAAAPKI